MSRSIPPLLQPGPRQAGNVPGGPGQAYPFAERRVADRRRPLLDCRQRDFRLRAVVQVSGVGIYDFDATTRTTYWSPELKAIAGIADDPGEISLDRLASLIHPEDRVRVRQKIEASLDPMESGQFEDEYRFVLPDGDIRWVKVRGQTFFNGEGHERHALGGSGIVIDITERRTAEALLREQSEELRLALRVGNSGTFQWDAHTHEHRWCDEMLALYGLQRHEFGGRDEDWLASLLPEDRGSAWAAVERSLRIGEYATSFRIRRRSDGEIRWISARGQVYFDLAGRPVRMVGINVDITDQKRDEEKLQESEARFRLMADAAPALIWVAGADKGCTWFNRPWLAFSGRRMEDELGYGWARALHPADLTPSLQTYESAFDRREAFSMEYRLRRHDGEFRWLLNQGIPRFEGDAFVGYIGSAIDITDYKLAQSSSDETRARLTAILDNLSEGVVVFDLGGQVLNMNPAARRMLRYATPEEARRRLPEFADTFDVRSLEGRSLPLDEWPISRVIRGESFNDYEIVVYRKDDGSSRIISHNGTPVPGPSGEIIVGVLTLWDVTDRKQGERALLASEEKYRTLFRNMTEGFALGEPILDQAGRPVDLRFLEVNEAFHQHTGIPKDILGRPVREYLPRVEQAWIDHYGAVALTGKADRFERYNADTRRHYDVYAFSPSPGRFALLFRDITESKLAEALLKESEEELRKFKFFSDHSNDGHLLIDQHCRIRYANRMVCKRLGYTEVELLRLHTSQVAPAYSNERIQEIFKYAKDHEMAPFEAMQRRKDGSSVPVEVSVTVLEFRGEWMMFSVSRDISERKRNELALQESARRLAVALAASGSAVWEMDVADGIVHGEDLLFTMLGYAPGELTTLAGWHGLVHAEDREGVSECVDEVVEGKRDSCRLEVRIRAKDGSWRWILSQAAAAERDVQGKAIRLVGTQTDIDERKAAEARVRELNARLERRVEERTIELQQANEALLRSNAELKHFAHATAHDLQTPLRAIAGFAQLLQREVRGLGSARFDRWASLVVENTKRLQSLIRDLLTYTGLDAQGLPFKTVDLRRLADGVIDSLSVLIEETGAEVSCGDLPALSVDRIQFAQVLQNLIENAIKYNRSTPPKVTIAAQLRGDEWLFSVTDNGIGIDPRHHERIFEIFRRLHAYHQVPGTGIGLALCRRIVERHGGRIWVESQPGEGSTFCFTLPLRAPMA